MTERTDGQKDGGTDAVEMLKAHRPMIRRESARRRQGGREGRRNLAEAKGRQCHFVVRPPSLESSSHLRVGIVLIPAPPSPPLTPSLAANDT